MVAIALPVIILLLILVLDLNRSQTGSAKLQAATDSSSLGTADWIFRARLDQLQKGNDVDIHTWLPPSSEITGYAQNLLEQNYAKDNPDSEINYGNFNANAKVTKNYTDVEVKGCADVNQSFGDKEGKKVCVDSTARIGNPKLVNTEIAIALNSVRQYYSKNEYDYLYLYGALFGGPPYAIPAGKQPLIEKWFGTAQEMKQNNARISFVPYTLHANIHPYEQNFMLNYDSNAADFSLQNMLGRYPVFNDDDFNKFINPASETQGAKNFKFSSAYDYFRHTPDENGDRGVIFEDIYPQLDQDKVLHTGQECRHFWALPFNYKNYYDWITGTPDYCEPQLVKQFYYDTAKNIVIQPLTDNPDTMKEFLRDWSGMQMEEGLYNSCNMPNPQPYLNSLLNATPADVREKYFGNKDTGSWEAYHSVISESHNGLLWAWMALSEQNVGKWVNQSVFEEKANILPDRQNVPLPKAKATKEVILFASGGITNSEFMANYKREYTGCDSYVEFNPDLTLNPWVRLQATVFDEIEVDGFKYNQPADSATFKKMCDAMKADGVGFNFIGDSGFIQWGPVYKYYPKAMQECASNGGTYKILNYGERYYETLDRILAKIAAKNSPDIRLVD
jgi:hypothetical protein